MYEEIKLTKTGFSVWSGLQQLRPQVLTCILAGMMTTLTNFH